MEIVNKKIDDLKPYENNPRFNDDAVQYVANSIKKFGFKNPMLIDKDNVIVAGHTRYKAAIELGLEKVPCIIVDDLTPEQVKAFRLADNKVGEIATWNLGLLDEELEEIQNIDMEELGFTKLKDIDLDDFFEENNKIKEEKYIIEIQFGSEAEMKDYEKELKEKGIKYIVK